MSHRAPKREEPLIIDKQRVNDEHSQRRLLRHCGGATPVLACADSVSSELPARQQSDCVGGLNTHGESCKEKHTESGFFSILPAAWPVGTRAMSPWWRGHELPVCRPLASGPPSLLVPRQSPEPVGRLPIHEAALSVSGELAILEAFAHEPAWEGVVLLSQRPAAGLWQLWSDEGVLLSEVSLRSTLTGAPPLRLLSGRLLVSGHHGAALLYEDGDEVHLSDTPPTCWHSLRGGAEACTFYKQRLFVFEDRSEELRSYSLDKQALHVVPTPDGRIVIVSTDGGRRVELSKYELRASSLFLLWSERHELNAPPSAAHLWQADAQGLFCLTKKELLRFSIEGELLWSRPLLEPEWGEEAHCINEFLLRTDGQGSVFVALTSTVQGASDSPSCGEVHPGCSPDGCQAAALIKYNSDGGVEWHSIRKNESSRALSLSLLPEPSLLIRTEGAVPCLKLLIFDS